MTELCPTCGAPVRVESVDEGTSFYVPIAPASSADVFADKLVRRIEQIGALMDVTSLKIKAGEPVDGAIFVEGLAKAIYRARQDARQGAATASSDDDQGRG